MTLPVWTGCDGCRQSSIEDESAKGKKRPAAAEEFTFGAATPLPASATGSSYIKAGHWYTLRQSIRSNESDQRGDLSFQTFATSKTAPGDAIADQEAGLISQRPAVLPKGRLKRLDARLLSPLERSSSEARITTVGQFISANSFVPPSRVEHPRMAADEYFFVVLTTRPERFASFQAADWVRLPRDEESLQPQPTNFRFAFPRSSGLLSLPDSMLDWTGTGCVLWDDLPPSEMTIEQRRALFDWLHFGGRLVVNGNAIAAELAGSELGKLLPISVQGMTDLEAESAVELIKQWSVAGDDSSNSVSALVRSQASRIAVGGPLAENSVNVARTADLLTARRVGRGEIVMSRFDLTSDWLTGWRSRDSFFNAAILARPGRIFSLNTGNISLAVRPGDNQQPGRVSTSGAMINSSLRLSSRDARLAFSEPTDESTESKKRKDAAAVTLEELTVHPFSGLGGWRDDSDVARLLQSVLREQSGVNIPPRDFVFRSLAIYLLLLVPANYVVFRLIGRLEWAWIATPFLALLGAGWIARTVSLDLGLARNHSEVALLELQPNYPRGHLTRFTSIYNSLSGEYEIRFADSDASAAPVERISKESVGLAPTVFKIGYDKGPSLANFSVPSNRTRFFHAEQIVDVAGSFTLDDDFLRNTSSLDLMNATVFRKMSSNAIEYASVGSIGSGSRVRLKWRTYDAQKDRASQIFADKLLAPFIDIQHMPPQCARLVAQIDDTIPGMQIVPETPRAQASTVIFAHLTHPTIVRSKGDGNLLPKRVERKKLSLDDDSNSKSVKEIVVP
jgi:hypothetical protein